MGMVIILSPEEATLVSGRTEDNRAAIEPVELSDGRYILGAEVLEDQAHVRLHGILNLLPQVEVSSVAEFLPRAVE